MTLYLVRARANIERIDEFRERLENGEFEGMRPFGRALTTALENAHFDSETDGAIGGRRLLSPAAETGTQRGAQQLLRQHNG
jgi:hypothetical protein